MPPTVEKPSQPHIQRLDVLRAIAIILVILFHFYGAVRFLPGFGLTKEEDATWAAVFAWGTTGVPLFFVISGFCIHLSFARTGRFEIGDFYWRRFARIYPAYVVSLIVFTLLGALKIIGTVNFKQFILHFLLIHNLFPVAIFHGINAAYWSLAVEFQFYLLYPLLLIIRARIGLKACLGIAVVLSLGYAILCGQFPVIPATVSDLTIVPGWYGWILGACLAEAYVAGVALIPGKGWAIPGAVVGLAAGTVVGSEFLQRLGSYVFFGAVLQNYLAVTRPLLWVERMLVPVGIVSYSLYLWHMPLLKFINRGIADLFHVPTTIAWQFAFYLPLTLLCLAPIAIVSYLLLECRATEWVRGMRKRRERPVSIPTTR